MGKNIQLKIPSNTDWKGYERDIGLQDFYKLVYGKKAEDIYYYFKNSAYISMLDELIHSNRKVFQYYIYAFALYLETIGKDDIDAQDGFLRLLLHREAKDVGSVCHIYHKTYHFQLEDEDFNKKFFVISLESIVNKIKVNIKDETVDKEIYSDFPKLIKNIENMC